MMSESFIDAALAQTPPPARDDTGSKLLRGLSGGLLDSQESSWHFELRGPSERGQALAFKRQEVIFTHRFVVDFLERARELPGVKLHLENFNALDAISQMALVDLRMFHSKFTNTATIRKLLRLRHRMGKDIEPYSFLEALGKTGAASEHTLMIPNDSPRKVNFYMLTESKVDSPIEYSLVAQWQGRDLENPEWLDDKPGSRECYLIHPFYFFISLGLYDYVIWKPRNDAGVVDSSIKISAVANLVLLGCFHDVGPFTYCDDYYIIMDLLLEKESFLASTEDNSCSTATGNMNYLIVALPSLEHDSKRKDVLGYSVSGMLNLWQILLANTYSRYCVGGFSQGYGVGREDFNFDNFGKLVAWFLRRGADPYFATRTHILDNSPSDTDPEEFRLEVFEIRLGATRSDSCGTEQSPLTVEARHLVRNIRREGFAEEFLSLGSWIQVLRMDDATKVEIMTLLDGGVHVNEEEFGTGDVDDSAPGTPPSSVKEEGASSAQLTRVASPTAMISIGSLLHG